LKVYNELTPNSKFASLNLVIGIVNLIFDLEATLKTNNERIKI